MTSRQFKRTMRLSHAIRHLVVTVAVAGVVAHHLIQMAT